MMPAESWSSIRCERLTARAGERDALVAALRRGAARLKAAGCDLDVRPSDEDPDVVWVTQVWRLSARPGSSPDLPAPSRRPALW